MMCALLLLATSCASIVGKSEYPVSISSNPTGAEISIVDRNGAAIYSGVTPTTVVLKSGDGYFRGAQYTVTFRQAGYETHSAEIKRGVDGWYVAGNFVFGGLVGYLVVDPITGAMWTLKDLHTNLKPIENNQEMEGVKISTLGSLPQHVQSQLVRVN